MVSLRESSDNLSSTIPQAAKKMGDPSRELVANVGFELMANVELAPADFENAHE